VSLFILVLVQIVGTEKRFTHRRILIGCDDLYRQATQELEWTPV
jgi:hypothetical protein